MTVRVFFEVRIAVEEARSRAAKSRVLEVPFRGVASKQGQQQRGNSLERYAATEPVQDCSVEQKRTA